MNADVRIDSGDRKGLERLLRYCARPAFSGERLKATTDFNKNADAMRLLYDINKNAHESQPPLHLTATEYLDKIAQLIPPPRRHRHHYHGVLAPNSRYRSRVTEFANQEFKPAKISSVPDTKGDELNLEAKADVSFRPKRSSLNWAKLIRKVYEVDPLKCEQCGEIMKIIAFIMDATSNLKILSHIGEDTEPPKLHSARGPPNESHREDEVIPEYQYDQTISW
ncbi:MAG: transposase [Pseudomonadota bacterium]|nr:transposase [Pseudomonadota bacterium]